METWLEFFLVGRDFVLVLGVLLDFDVILYISSVLHYCRVIFGCFGIVL